MCELKFPKPKRKRKRPRTPKSVMDKGKKRLWSIFTPKMDRCMYTGERNIERHHVFSHTPKERARCEVYGFIAPLKPELHPNGVHAGKQAAAVDKELKRRCREYYLKHYGTEEEFRKEFYYVS